VIKKVFNNEKVSSTVVYGGGKSDHYLENFALHYFCRPLTLENLSPREFFEEYNVTVIRKDPKDGEPDLRFISDTGFFKHPSAKKTRKRGTEQCRQGVQPHAKGRLDIKVSQWSFPDTAQFKNNILTCPASAINQSMEEYAYTMLLLFHHYRSHEDLLPAVTAASFPYVMKLREIYEHEVLLESVPKHVFTERNMTFLQNIQNCAHNSLRYKVGTDDLQSVTECFRPEQVETCNQDENQAQEFEDEEDVPYELFMEYVDEKERDDHDPFLFHHELSDYSFQPIRNRGLNGCGCNNKIPEIVVENALEDEHDDWVDVVENALEDEHDDWVDVVPVQKPTQINTSNSVTEIPEWKVLDIVKLLLRKTAARSRPKVFKSNVEETT
jgi:hypothetical protein